ncbi:hypothetical protein ACFQYP_21940 [Nonomuraea antimicrobica]
MWSDAEVPLPVESGDFARTLSAPGWLVSGTRADGVVRVVNHGADHTDPARWHSDDPLYARLAYSTHAAPETPEDPRGGPVDSSVVLVDAAGHASHRRPLRRVSVEGRVAVSRSRAHWPADERWDCFGGPDTGYRLGPWITVASVLRGALEVRLARVDPAPESPDDDPGPWQLRLGGWAVPTSDGPTSDGPTNNTGEPADGPTEATVRGGGLHSTVVGLHGFDRAHVHHGSDSNALSPASATPGVLADEVRFGRPYAAAVHLAGTPLAAEHLPEVRFESEESAVVRWPDGERDLIHLTAPPHPRVPRNPLRGNFTRCMTTDGSPRTASPRSSTGSCGPRSTARGCRSTCPPGVSPVSPFPSPRR